MRSLTNWNLFRLYPRRLVAAGAALLMLSSSPAEARDEGLSPVEPMDWSIAGPGDVSDAYAYRPFHHNGKNRSLAYYLEHFHRLANAVREEEPDRGFIDLSVWRRPRDNEPYNARVMENILSLAWLYARDEPWNPYYGDEAVRRRLEAAMEFWVDSQNEEGRFSEYGPERWNLPATAFATKFMSETLIQLDGGPPVDAEVLERVREANRRAIQVTLNDDGFWNHAQRFTNQYGNAFAGALGYLDLYEDPEMAADLKRQMVKALDAFLSPAGYLYEADGPDWAYYFGTHHSNVHMAWHYGRGRSVDGVDFGDLVAREYEKTTEWLAYNAVPQPGGERFFLNRSAETRQSRAFFDRLETPLSEVVPLARAFSVTEEERRERLAWSRRELEREWGDPPELHTGSFSAYSPYAFLHREHDRWYPTEAERREAREQLPYFARDRFTHQRRDDRIGDTYTYIRRQGYYAAFNSGPRDRDRPRRGIGLLWTPEYGTLIQSQSASNDFAWGTRRLSDDNLREAHSMDPVFAIEGEEIAVEDGIRDLPRGRLLVRYGMRDGWKAVLFEESAIRVRVVERDDDGEGKLVEQIPFLLDDGDELDVEADRVALYRAGQLILEVRFNGPGDIRLKEGERIGDLQITAVHAEATGQLEYELQVMDY